MAKKETSARISTLAAKTLARIAESKRDSLDAAGVTVEDVRSLCASVLSQDETKGQLPERTAEDDAWPDNPAEG